MNSIEHSKYLTFLLDNRCYLVTVDHVREVIKCTSLDPIPGANFLVDGMLTVRGDLMTVVSGRKLFAIPASTARNESHIVVLDISGELYGLSVDRVDQIREIENSLIDRTTASDDGHIIGTVQVDGVLHILIDFSEIHANLE